MGDWKTKRNQTYLKCDVVIPHSDLELLLPHDVLFWPVCVVFPRGRKRCEQSTIETIERRHDYLMTSLCSTMRLSSFTTKGPTHTEADETRWEVWLVVGRASNTQKTHSLCGSGNRFCSWSCLHIEDVHESTQTRGTRAHACQNGRYYAQLDKWRE